MSTAAPSTAGVRLEQVDGLRALAALSVVGFHFTTRYEQVFAHTRALEAGFDLGYLGVNLFFVISGFVIFMTIEAAKSPQDFAFSRFSRLFPTYWAAVLLTWLLTLLLPIPGNVRALPEVLANFTMVHEGFGFKSVDGAYWSLEIEIVYYLWMLALWSLGWLRRPHLVIVAWLAAALAAAAANAARPATVPHTLMHYALLGWIPWFGLGMVAYLAYRQRASAPFIAAVSALALAAIACRSGPVEVLAGLGAGLAVWLASRGRLRLAGWRPLVFIGAISYPLYLLHEQFGWLFMLQLQQRGIDPWLSIVGALVFCIAAAWTLRVTVEMPAMRWLRAWWRRHAVVPPSPGVFRRATVASLAALMALAIGSIATTKLRLVGHGEPLAEVNDWPRAPAPGCAPELQRELRILVVLGQSNAASHAEPVAGASEIPVIHEGRCRMVADPLPGTSGRGASLWTALLPRLDAARPGVVDAIMPLAVGDTTIAQWVAPGRLRDMLSAELAALSAQQDRVDFVLWQQGEADMLRGTEAAHYLRDLRALRRLLDEAGVRAPLVVARSTRCFAPGLGAGSVRRVLERHETLLRGERIVLGPDTDGIGGEGRSDGCHFNERGRREAATLWLRTLTTLLRGG
ncbi:acyltransferase family protein [Piscinibacter sp.]|uniref:acyltransferase family protein n=1 Tax=Piscinibacter sp. TaxID=1903157 RepID=UPI0039E42923